MVEITLSIPENIFQHAPPEADKLNVSNTLFRHGSKWKSFTISWPVVIAIFFWSCAKESGDYKTDHDVLYANTAKTVKYVGSEECATCHQSIYQSYMQSEMGRSMSRLDSTNIIEEYPQTYEVYDSVKNFYYQMVKKDGRFYQREYRLNGKGRLLHERWMEAGYVIGSGNNLRMYFHNENGMLYQLPLTWYVHKKRWDLSPGYRQFGNLRFSRYASAKCISCHNSYLEVSLKANERYLEPFALGIGCERCHGPGELHIRQKMGEKLHYFPSNAQVIVNPRKLSPEMQLDVCRQCHLQGKASVLRGEGDWFDFRPGQLLKTHRSVYYPATTQKEIFEVADSPHRLSLSRCFLESNGTMTCITCHNPHFSIKTFPAEHYNGKCLQCHALASLPGNGSRYSHAGTDDCVSCHMNRTGTDKTLHGVSNTDHWIRIDANRTVIDWTSLKKPPEQQSLVTLVAVVDANDASSLVRKGIAYFDYYKTLSRQEIYLDSARSYLLAGLRYEKDDAQGFFYLGEVQIALKRYEEAIAALERSVALRHGQTETLYKLGWAYSLTNKLDVALRYHRQAVELKPNEPSYLEELATVLDDLGNYEEAMTIFKRTLQLDQQNPFTYYSLGNLYVQKLRQPEKAIPYYKELVMLDPDFPNGYLNLGSAYALLGNYKEAAQFFERELLAQPQSPLAFFNLGRVYMLMGRRSEARDAFRKVLAIEPSMSLAQEYLEQLQK